MITLSSNITLILRIFIPTAWLSFFGLFLAVIFLVDSSDKPLLANGVFRITFVSIFFLFLTLIYFTLWRLKRVETDGKSLFVTDYFKTARYPLEDVERISITNLFILKLGTVVLKDKGTFGRKLPFVAKNSNLKDFKNYRPNLF